MDILAYFSCIYYQTSLERTILNGPGVATSSLFCGSAKSDRNRPFSSEARSCKHRGSQTSSQAMRAHKRTFLPLKQTTIKYRLT